MNSVEKGRIVCSFCGEEISLNAKRCPYCGSVLGIENSLNIDEVKTDSFKDDSFQKQDIGSDLSQGKFDNSINSENHINDFIHEDNYKDEKSGLFDTKPNDYIDNNRGMIENSPNESMEEKNGMFDAKPNEQVEEEITKQRDLENNVEDKTSQEPIPARKPDTGNINNRQQKLPMGSPDMGNAKPSISNAMKVFITSICNFIPGIGQLVGVIIAVVFMNSEGDTDKRSFGLALLVNSIIVFVIMCISCCVLAIAFSET